MYEWHLCRDVVSELPKLSQMSQNSPNGDLTIQKWRFLLYEPFATEVFRHGSLLTFWRFTNRIIIIITRGSKNTLPPPSIVTGKISMNKVTLTGELWDDHSVLQSFRGER